MTMISDSSMRKEAESWKNEEELEREELDIDVDDSVSSATVETETVVMEESKLFDWGSGEYVRLDRKEENDQAVVKSVGKEEESKLTETSQQVNDSLKSTLVTPTTYSKRADNSSYQVVIAVLLFAILIGLLSHQSIKSLFETKEKPNPWKVPQLIHQTKHNLYDGKTNLQLSFNIPVNNSLETDFHFSIKVEDSKYVNMYNFSTFELLHNSSHECFQDFLIIRNVIYHPKMEFMVNYSMPIRMEKKCFEHYFTKLPNELSFQVKIKDYSGINHFFTFNQTIKANFFMGKFEKILNNLNGKIVKFLSIGKSGTGKSTGIVELYFFRDISNTPEVPIELPAKMVSSHVTVMLSDYNMSYVLDEKQSYQFPLPIVAVDPMGFLNVTDFDEFLITGRLPYHEDLVAKCKKNVKCLESYDKKPISLPDVILYYISPEQIESQAEEINQRLTLIAKHGLTCILMFPSGHNLNAEVDLSFINGKFSTKFFLYDFYKRDEPETANNPNIFKRNAELLMRILEVANGKRVSELKYPNMEKQKTKNSKKNSKANSHK